MNWTRTPPTKPGAYWHQWKKKADGGVFLFQLLVEIESHDGILWDISADLPVMKVGGEWCGPLVSVDEVEKAYSEGWQTGAVGNAGIGANYHHSRARRIVEGENL